MLDIFGSPDWPGLAGGIFGDLLRGLLEGLNWLLLVVPFWLAASIAGQLQSKESPNWIIAPVAVVVFFVPFALYYLAYPYVEFPYFMRWVHH